MTTNFTSISNSPGITVKSIETTDVTRVIQYDTSCLEHHMENSYKHGLTSLEAMVGVLLIKQEILLDLLLSDQSLVEPK